MQWLQGLHGVAVIDSKSGPKIWALICFFLVWVGFEVWALLLRWCALDIWEFPEIRWPSYRSQNKSHRALTRRPAAKKTPNS